LALKWRLVIENRPRFTTARQNLRATKLYKGHFWGARRKKQKQEKKHFGGGEFRTAPKMFA